MDTPTPNQTTDTTKAERYTPKPGEWGYRTPQEIEALKRDWRLGDWPSPLQEASGFEAYYDELKAYAESYIAGSAARNSAKAAEKALAAKLAAPFVTDGPYGLRLENIEAIRAQTNGVLVLWPGHGPSNMEVCVTGEYAKALWKKLTGTEWPTPPENKPEPASADNPLYDEDGHIVTSEAEPLNSHGSLYPYEAPAAAKPEPDLGAAAFEALAVEIAGYESDTFSLPLGPTGKASAQRIAAHLIRKLTQGLRDHRPLSFFCDGVMLSDAALEQAEAESKVEDHFNPGLA